MSHKTRSYKLVFSVISGLVVSCFLLVAARCWRDHPWVFTRLGHQSRLDSGLASAIFERDLLLIQYAIDRGADPNGVNWNQSYLTDVNSLLSVKDRDYDRSMPMIAFPVLQNEHDIVLLLIRNGAKLDVPLGSYSLISMAARESDTEMLRILLDNGVDVNCIDEKGRDALYNAILLDRLEVVKLLIEYGADLEKKYDDSSGSESGSFWFTPLYVALREDQIEIVKYLIENGVDANQEVVAGKYAIEVAHDLHRLELAELLGPTGGD